MIGEIEEYWKEVIGYEGIYEVSNKGKIRSSKDKTTKSTLHGERKWKQRILKQKTDKKGYKRVTLYKEKIPDTFLVHRLVAMSFINKIEGKELINHIDCNPSNNYVSNLEWCTHKENNDHAWENNLYSSNDIIILKNTNTGELLEFNSKTKASLFLGRNHGFLHHLLKSGLREVDEYKIFTNK